MNRTKIMRKAIKQSKDLGHTFPAYPTSNKIPLYRILPNGVAYSDCEECGRSAIVLPSGLIWGTATMHECE